ncbi:MAG: lysine--tRNA ligase [Rickettsiales bacterium]|jgi:lysyl-tRNA synthetase class 2|nr:lysine--tRNA ligase [Rickettsiales bacterium]
MTTENNDTTDYRQIRLNKLDAVRNLKINPYPSNFRKDSKAKDLLNKYADLTAGEKTEDVVIVAGRIMSIRNNGMFIDLHDDSDKIQIFSHKNNLDETQQELLKTFDLGDIIGVKGKVRCTPRGEITIDSSELTLLSKSLLTLPEKYHGLHDVETRYRQRYVDLIVNDQSKEILRKRSLIVSAFRTHLTDLDFLEVETPMLHPIPGGAIAKPFVTHHNTLDMELYLRIAPELYLKKLLVGGLSEKIFEINRCFRNEGISTRHNPEFTSIEVYQAYVGFEEMIELTENIINEIVKKINKSAIVNYEDKELHFSSPWKRASMSDLVLEKTGVNFMTIHSDEEARAAARNLDVKVENSFGWGKSLEAVFAEKVEESLIDPIHITYLPAEISPLAKICSDDPRITERFETYINGWEIANGFSELNDPIDQLNRFEQQVKARDAGDDEAHHVDEDFITALEHAMPPAGGLGIGIDRLAMILTNSASIREVIAFPTLRQKVQPQHD